MFLNKLKKFFVANFRLFSLIIPIVILAFGYLYLLKPKYNYLKKTGSLTLQSLNNTLQIKKEYLANLEKLKISYNTLGMEDKEKLEQILVSQKDIPNLFVHFENLIRENGMEPISINFSETKAEEKVRTLNVDLALGGGNYQIFKKFLAVLERDIKIVDVVFAGFLDDGYSLKLKTYYLDKSFGGNTFVSGVDDGSTKDYFNEEK